MKSLYKIDRNGIKRFVRENQFAKIATNNFLAALGIYLYEEGKTQEEIAEAFSKMDSIIGRDDNLAKLEELVGIRLTIEG